MVVARTANNNTNRFRIIFRDENFQTTMETLGKYPSHIYLSAFHHLRTLVAQLFPCITHHVRLLHFNRSLCPKPNYKLQTCSFRTLFFPKITFPNQISPKYAMTHISSPLFAKSLATSAFRNPEIPRFVFCATLRFVSLPKRLLLAINPEKTRGNKHRNVSSAAENRRKHLHNW